MKYMYVIMIIYSDKKHIQVFVFIEGGVSWFWRYLTRGLLWHLNIFHKALNLFKFKSEITLESIPGTNQY